MFEVSDMRSWLMAGSTGTEEMKGTLTVYCSHQIIKKWFHKNDLSLNFRVVYDVFMSIIGMAFHKDGKRW